MSKTIELSTGKVIDLSRFVALLPNYEKEEAPQYSLLLEGSTQPVNLNPEEAKSVKEYLQLNNQKKHNGAWDREEQIRLNQPKMRKLKEKISKMQQEQPSVEKAAFFESFKKTMDAQRPKERKLYEQ